MDSMFLGEDLMFTSFPIIFVVVVFLILGTFVVTIISGISTWNKNNHSPILNVEAKVVTKRTNVSRHSNSNDIGAHSSTYYYATFQVESGDRMEFQITGKEYGMLAEGDFGKLTFQGTRYLGFER